MGNDSATLSLELLLATEQDKLRRALLSDNTRNGYAYDFALFGAWCKQMGRESLPATPETVSLFLTDQLSNGKKVATAVRRTSAIAHIHRAKGYENPVTPEIRRLLKGARRLRGERPREKRPLSTDELRAIVEKLIGAATPIAMRNRAILVLGFLAALRRDELSRLELRDVEVCEKGLVLTIRRSKTDQEGNGRYVALPVGKNDATCPVKAFQGWLAHRGNAPGPLFTHTRAPSRDCRIRGEAICRMIKACVRMIGVKDASEYGGHSLRSGFVTAATDAGAGDLQVAFQTGHRSMSTLRRYFRKRDLWRSNAAAMIGL